MAQTLWFETALLPDGWADRVNVEIADGVITSVAVDAAPSANRYAIGLPAVPNLHSHAFQYGFAGLAERNGGHDSFWSWRDQMYRMVERLTPEDVVAISTMAYVEMLEAGFGRVGEFHYLHHQPDGSAYDHPAQMAEAIVEAARLSGIAVTLLPVFYAHSDFGGVPPTPGQRRFLHDLSGFHRLLDYCGKAVSALDGAVLGVAPHSLRAVRQAELHELVQMRPHSPFHIHIAEQQREVEASLAYSGTRPVEWLLDHFAIDERWCLVHATHINSDELSAVARSGAVVGLCPLTEANLGDGIFSADDYLKAHGRFGIGSDSNVLIDVAAELQLLEYGQRLKMQHRNVLAPAGASVGGTLFRGALSGGAQALGVPASALASGQPADILALRADFVPATADQHLDRWIFARGKSAVDAVWRNGRQLVCNGRHIHRERVEQTFFQAMHRLHQP